MAPVMGEADDPRRRSELLRDTLTGKLLRLSGSRSIIRLFYFDNGAKVLAAAEEGKRGGRGRGKGWTLGRLALWTAGADAANGNLLSGREREALAEDARIRPGGTWRLAR